jgi:hypothetical protein
MIHGSCFDQLQQPTRRSDDGGGWSRGMFLAYHGKACRFPPFIEKRPLTNTTLPDRSTSDDQQDGCVDNSVMFCLLPEQLLLE